MKTYRICPCHGYDMDGIQSWLEDLASEGLHLSGRIPGFLQFDRSTPRKSRYRLQPNPNTIDRFRSHKLDLRYLAGEFGWEFVLRYGSFDIYRTDDPKAPELNTDPRIQAMTLDALKTERKNRVLLLAFHFVISLLLRPNIQYFYLNTVLLGIIFVSSFYLLLLWVFLVLAGDIWWIHRVQKKLLQGEAFTEKVRRKGFAVLPVFTRIFPVVLLTAVLVLLGTGFVETNRDIALADHAGDPPFVTYSDLAAPNEYQQINTDSIALNSFAVWSRCISPVNYRWLELGNFIDEPGIARSLSVDYHETASEWFARGLAEDYYRQSKNSGEFFIEYFVGFDYPDLGVDYFQVYHVGGYHYVLLQHGNIVIRADVSNQGTDDDLWLRWAQAMAQQLLNTEKPDA